LELDDPDALFHPIERLSTFAEATVRQVVAAGRGDIRVISLYVGCFPHRSTATLAALPAMSLIPAAPFNRKF
jgi:hypothetical protein